MGRSDSFVAVAAQIVFAMIISDKDNEVWPLLDRVWMLASYSEFAANGICDPIGEKLRSFGSEVNVLGTLQLIEFWLGVCVEIVDGNLIGMHDSFGDQIVDDVIAGFSKRLDLSMGNWGG